MMVEAGAKEVSEDEDAAGAILFAHEEIKKICRLPGSGIIAEIGKEKRVCSRW